MSKLFWISFCSVNTFCSVTCTASISSRVLFSGGCSTSSFKGKLSAELTTTSVSSVITTWASSRLSVDFVFDSFSLSDSLLLELFYKQMMKPSYVNVRVSGFTVRHSEICSLGTAIHLGISTNSVPTGDTFSETIFGA